VGFRIGGKQRFDFGAQLRIVCANLIEIGTAFGGGAL
jgi:hypothetical protein